MSQHHPTILVLGGTGLFGSKVCLLLQRVSRISNLRVAVAGRRQEVSQKFVTAITSDQHQQKNSTTTVNFFAAPAIDVLDLLKLNDNTDNSSSQNRRTGSSLGQVLDDLKPDVVINATGAHHVLSLIAEQCIIRGCSLVDLSDDATAITHLEDCIKQLPHATGVEIPEGKGKVLIASGISTSPALTSCIVNELVGQYFERSNAAAVAATVATAAAKDNRLHIPDDLQDRIARNSLYQGKKQQQKQKEEEQKPEEAANSSDNNNNGDSVPLKRKELSCEIVLSPGMKAIPAAATATTTCNTEAGVSTVRAIFQRIGVRYEKWCNGRIESEAPEVAFRRTYSEHIAPPIGPRLVSPCASPDVFIGRELFRSKKIEEEEEEAARKFRMWQDPTRPQRAQHLHHIDPRTYGHEFVTTRSLAAQEKIDPLREVVFVAGLQIPRVHWLVTRMPKWLVKLVAASSSSTSYEKKKKSSSSSQGGVDTWDYTPDPLTRFIAFAFRLSSKLGKDVGCLQVRLVQHTDTMHRDSDNSRHLEEFLSFATAATMLVTAENGAGVYLPAVPAVALALSLLSNKNINNTSSDNNSNRTEIVFWNGAIRREHCTNPTATLPHPAAAALQFPQLKALIQQAFPNGDITFNESTCLFQYVVGAAEWSRVNPVVRAFHELTQSTSMCADTFNYCHERKSVRLRATVHSPPPRNALDRFILKALQLPHNMHENTGFTIDVVASPFQEEWRRIYPVVTMITTLRAGETRRSVAGGTTDEPRKCVKEVLLRGLVELDHVFTVEDGTGALLYHVVGATALWGWIPVPQFLMPTVFARESCDEKTGKFRFEIEATLPIVGTKVSYRGNVALGDVQINVKVE